MIFINTVYKIKDYVMNKIQRRYTHFMYKTLSRLGSKFVSLGFSIRDKGVSLLFKED